MKSSQTQLNQRGQLNQDKLVIYQSLSYKELIEHLKDDAQTRTICIHLLSLKYHNHPDFTVLLLNQLKKETALYTKIEIQNNLSLYGDIHLMCEYLGQIGKNQYRDLPLKVSLKKSYPLPRDIIARSLSYISNKRFQLFITCLPSLSYHQLLEAIDAVGFFCFYHHVITEELYQFIIECIEIYQHDELMIWKLTTCLSAFPQSQSILKYIQNTQKHSTILKEVERSLKLIDQSYNH